MQSNKKIILVFIFFLIILSLMQYTVPNIIGFDGYYHAKSAELLRKNGFYKDFVWAKYTILSEKYADIQVLFRILLAPFTFFGEHGIKIASVIFSSVCFTFFYFFLKENKIKFPFYWTLLYLFSAESLMYRFMVQRQMPLAITFILLSIYFIQKEKYFFLYLVSFGFVWLYSGFVIQIFIIMSYLIIQWFFLKKIYYKTIICSLAGAASGIIIHPYFPNNIPLLYTQIFKVNLIANLYNAEWKPWTFLDFIKNNLLILFFIVTAIILIAKEKKLSKNKFIYLFLSLFFLAYTIKSKRMQEYLVPFSILLLSYSINELLDKLNTKSFKYFKIGSIIFLLILGTINFAYLRKDIINNNFYPNFNNCVEWMRQNIKPNLVVFNNAYTFPYLFFKNDKLIYTHGIDLTYSYLYDKEKFKKYGSILKGDALKDKDWIKMDYRPDYVFAGKLEQDIKLYNYIIYFKENYKALYEDEWCAVLKVNYP